MALGLFDFVETIVVHSEFLDRLDQAEVSFRTARRAAESLGPVIDIMQSRELQSGIASADIAAEPHLPVGLGECPKDEGAIRPGSNHGASLEPADSQCRINFLPAVLAGCVPAASMPARSRRGNLNERDCCLRSLDPARAQSDQSWPFCYCMEIAIVSHEHVSRFMNVTP
jgi:hypothetical protein